jgi:hypothetical protein
MKMEQTDPPAKVASNDQLGPIAWMVTNDDGQDAYVTADPLMASKGQRALALYATVPAVQLELERTAAALALELAEARHALEKLRTPHPRLRVEYWTGQWWEPLQGEALDATLAALEPAPKWSVALGA